ncbi:MAG: GPW/gp25 family protein [Gammaproteobacteria bacterium]|nr:GPW/gp25 family protein [Gammaproteobacteria bacterium]
MANDQSKAFLGRGWSFPPQFERSDEVLQLQMVSLEEDIRESLAILLATLPGERVMQPSFGCGLNALVFDNVSQSSITKITDLVERAILFFETRITLENLEVLVDDESKGLIQIHLDYTIRTINTRSNFVYPFYFQEGTDISI